MKRTPFFWPRFILAVVLMLTVIPYIVVYRAAREWVPHFFAIIGKSYMRNVYHLRQAVSEHRL